MPVVAVVWGPLAFAFIFILGLAARTNPEILAKFLHFGERLAAGWDLQLLAIIYSF